LRRSRAISIAHSLLGGPSLFEAAASLTFVRHLEGLLAEVVVGVLDGLAPAATATATEVAAAAALVAGDLGARPGQARADLVGDDLDHAALLAVLGLPAALLEAAGDDDARALAQRLGDVLGHLAPADDVEEAGLLLPLLRLAVLPAA